MSGNLKLNTSSGGSIALTPADTVSNITVTVPAATGTLLTTATAGSILQVVQGVKSDTFSTSSATFVEVTGLNASITPSSATNKVLVTCSVAAGYNNDGTATRRSGMSLFRGSTNLVAPTSPGSRTPTFAWATELSSNEAYDIYTFQFLDSPNTTSSTNYNIRVLNSGAGASTIFINRSEIDADQASTGRAVSTITLTEIVA
jgi:hypothetical protein